MHGHYPGARRRMAQVLTLLSLLLSATLISNPRSVRGAMHAASRTSTVQRSDDARLATAPLTPRYWVYVVRTGDTLVSIAEHFHDSAWLISRRNGGNWHPSPGTRLLVWRWPFFRQYMSAVDAVVDNPETYRVRAGDSLFSISRDLHVTLARLCGDNKLSTGSLLLPGRILLLHHFTHHLTRQYISGDGAVQVPAAFLLTDIARYVGVEPALFKALVWKESNWRMVSGRSGEIGMVQMMPTTAAWVQQSMLGYQIDPHVTVDNALLGALLLLHYLDASRHNVRDALALYHSSNTLPSARNRVYTTAILLLRDHFRRHPY